MNISNCFKLDAFGVDQDKKQEDNTYSIIKKQQPLTSAKPQ